MGKERPNVMSYADVAAWECSENTYFFCEKIGKIGVFA